ncbi:MAG TPA: Calx-beta domain-containing protein, partial [Gaiellaceae bacterium]|nr:Calx-beta domain-containing protein [Gaiellaceae bacterium]
ICRSLRLAVPRESSSRIVTVAVPRAIVATVAVADVSITEGDSGTKLVTITVTLSRAAAVNVTVGYATSNGTATAGSDYYATSGTLTFAPGQTVRTFTVTIVGDRSKEPNETFLVHLTGATVATIARGTATVTILDDDSRGTASLSDRQISSSTTPTLRAAKPKRIAAPALRKAPKRLTIAQVRALMR